MHVKIKKTKLIMESLVESKNCKNEYAEIVKCIDLKKTIAFEKRLSIFQECKE